MLTRDRRNRFGEAKFLNYIQYRFLFIMEIDEIQIASERYRNNIVLFFDQNFVY